MLNNTTCCLLLHSFNTSNYYYDAKSHNILGSHELWLVGLVAIAILSPFAVVGNGLVLAAIWKNPSLRTPSYILLAGLAFTDFCTGLITEPYFVANELIFFTYSMISFTDKKSWPTFYLITRTIGDGCLEYFFFNMTLMMITLMSIEWWLHMSRRSLITVRRLYHIFAVLFFLPIPLAVYRVEDIGNRAFNIVGMLDLVLCLCITSVAYFKVFRIIRRHQQQIHANVLSQSFAQPAINLEKYKKSAFSIMYIVIIFYIGYLPKAMTWGLLLFVTVNKKVVLKFFFVSFVLAFLSSSLNPLLYLWRMKDIRDEVRKMVKQLFCLHN